MNLETKSSSRLFIKTIILMVLLNLSVAILYRWIMPPTISGSNNSSESNYALALLGDIAANLFLPYFIKEFCKGNIQVFFDLKYHYIPTIERFLLLPVIVILIIGLYLIIKKYDARLKIHPVLFLLGGVWFGSALANGVELLIWDSVANYIKISHTFNFHISSSDDYLIGLFETLFFLNSSDIFMLVSLVGIFWSLSALVLIRLWKIKQRAVCFFIVFLLITVLGFPFLSTPSWVVNAHEYINQYINNDRQQNEIFNFPEDAFDGGMFMNPSEPNFPDPDSDRDFYL